PAARGGRAGAAAARGGGAAPTRPPPPPARRSGGRRPGRRAAGARQRGGRLAEEHAVALLAEDGEDGRRRGRGRRLEAEAGLLRRPGDGRRALHVLAGEALLLLADGGAPLRA